MRRLAAREKGLAGSRRHVYIYSIPRTHWYTMLVEPLQLIDPTIDNLELLDEMFAEELA